MKEKKERCMNCGAEGAAIQDKNWPKDHFFCSRECASKLTHDGWEENLYCPVCPCGCGTKKEDITSS
ncbi:MAG: hypothetical protein D6785_05365 [Planctomycetota bacterium]|nr:MAG: hypothetical protein D6785_05365 [Planctomycetota bacterium]